MKMSPDMIMSKGPFNSKITIVLRSSESYENLALIFDLTASKF